MRRERDVSPVNRRRGGDGAQADQARGFDAESAFPLRRVMRDDGSADPADVKLSDPELVALYELMVLNRMLDERMIAMQRQGRIGFYIGSIGEEATILGSARAMEPQDWLFPSYREHGAVLMRGMPLETFVCNLLGNAGDAVLGHQMPCHEAWRPANFASVSSPIATQIPHAVGAAWAARIKGDDMVSLAWFGEGATSAADFHAGLNFAGVHKVPVVFLCRNNGWAISVPRDVQTGSETIAQKAIAYGIAGERVDGNDLLAVLDATRRARARAAAGEGPTLVECVTYRLEGHSTSDDPRAYRPAEVVEPWRRKDPIARMRAFLEKRGLLRDADDTRIRDAAKHRILDAIHAAEREPPKPEIGTMFEGVYAEPLWQQREQLARLRDELGQPELPDDDEDTDTALP
ncbi:MAG TPA: thiamine pyrophosphate-dependent enzyme [Anaeromyxobacteraceae bacterium]|nr:thiamine pyrophosphate-dependent enzyme [Anaeromyxobacteraceae bacterium]